MVKNRTKRSDQAIALRRRSARMRRIDRLRRVAEMVQNPLEPLFEATVQATEEAIVNALVAAQTMTGNRGNTSTAIDHDALKEVLREYKRLVDD